MADEPSTKVLSINPELAAKLLASNTGNRKVKKDAVARYARDMKAGKWQMTGEPIVLNSDGRVLNGQHRLLACVEAGVSFTSLVVSGIASEAMENLDSGVRRSLADVLGMRGYASTSSLATTIRAVAAWGAAASRLNMTNSEAIALLEDRPEIPEAVRMVNGNCLNASPLRWPMSAAGVLGAEVLRTGAGDFEQFCRLLKRPGAVGTDHPVNQFREILIRWSTSQHVKPSQRAILGTTMRAWNMWVTGERGVKLVFRASSNAMPPIRDDQGLVKSAYGAALVEHLDIRFAAGHSFSATDNIKAIKLLAAAGLSDEEIGNIVPAERSTISRYSNRGWQS